MIQAVLVTGFCHCDNCRATVERVRKIRQWYLCDACWSVIMPDYEPPDRRHWSQRDAEWQARQQRQQEILRAFWEWYGDMEERYPERAGRFFYDPYWGTKRYLRWGRQAGRERQTPLEADAYWPLCDCGQPREAMRFGDLPPGLFGGPFRPRCAVCEAKLEVETLREMAAHIHPEWDDEDWLDALQKSHRHLFDLGVLPDAWYMSREANRP